MPCVFVNNGYAKPFTALMLALKAVLFVCPLHPINVETWQVTALNKSHMGFIAALSSGIAPIIPTNVWINSPKPSRALAGVTVVGARADPDLILVTSPFANQRSRNSPVNNARRRYYFLLVYEYNTMWNKAVAVSWEGAYNRLCFILEHSSNHADSTLTCWMPLEYV